jgi:RHS repeat-associated protein
MPIPSKHSPCVGIRTCSDYSPFGVELDGRTVSGGYRFGFHGSEKDNEFKGEGNSYTTEFRQLDPRLGRWLSVDPLFEEYSWQSPYCAINNCSILLCDPLGLEAEGGPGDEEGIKDRGTTTRDVVVTRYRTKEQKRHQNWNRFLGGLNFVWGFMEASAGTAFIASGVAAPLGWLLVVHGSDIAVAGGNQMLSGRKQETLTFKGTKQLVKSCGASEHRAEDIATFVDCSLSLGLGTAALVKQSMSRVAPKIVVEATEGVIKSYDDFVKEAQRLYPNKAGKIELHHITPKYLGGSKNGAVVPLDASYHQVITNEFRSLWPYGNGIPSATELKNIMNQVYAKYPLPPVR